MKETLRCPQEKIRLGRHLDLLSLSFESVLRTAMRYVLIFLKGHQGISEDVILTNLKQSGKKNQSRFILIH